MGTSEMKESYSSLAIGMVPFLTLVPPWKPGIELPPIPQCKQDKPPSIGHLLLNVDEEMVGISSIGLQHSSTYQHRREPILMSPSDQQQGNDIQVSLQVYQKGMGDTSLDNKVTIQEWNDDNSVTMDERKIPPGTINIKGIR